MSYFCFYHSPSCGLVDAPVAPWQRPNQLLVATDDTGELHCSLYFAGVRHFCTQLCPQHTQLITTDTGNGDGDGERQSLCNASDVDAGESDGWRCS